MYAGRLVVTLIASAIVSCSGSDAPRPSPSSGPVELHRIDAAPTWAVRYGAEFWRPRAAVPDVPSTPGVKVSSQLDLDETMERVDHAFAADESGALRSRGATYSATVDASRVRFTPGDATDVTATISLHRLERGALAADTTAAGDAFVLGNTRQRRLALGSVDVVEHVEARAEGVELTWVLSAAPAGEGPLQLAFGIDGLAPAGRTASGHHFGDASGVARVRVSDAVLRDAAGSEWKLPLAEDDDGLALDVPATILASARYPLAIDPVISAELGMDTPLTGPVITASPKIECGGGTCLAVWQDSRTGATKVMGTLFDSASGVVLNPLGLTLFDSSSGLVDVTFTGTDFLVVTRVGSSAMGRRVTTGGATPDVPFTIVFGSTPTAIASSGTTSLVVLNTPSGNIDAALLSGTTVVSNFSISTDPASEQWADVAWDGSAFVITWWYFNSTDWDTMIARVGIDGSILSAPALLAGGAGSQYLARVCGGGSSGSLVAWWDSAPNSIKAQRFDGAFAPVGTVISLGAMGTSLACASDGSRYFVLAGQRRNVIDKATGALTSAVPGISNGASWTDPDATYDGTRFVAVYTKYAGNYLGFVQRFATDGTSLDASDLPLQSLAQLQAAPVTASSGSQYAVLWAEQSVTGLAVRGVILDDTGAPLDPAGFTLAASSENAPALTASPDGSGYFAVWRASSGLIQGRRITAIGELGPPLTIATGSSSKVNPTVMSDGVRFIATWFEFNSPNVDVHAANVSTSDVVSAPFIVHSSVTNTAAGAVRTACLPSRRCVVAWTNANGYDVQMKLLQDGALVDGTLLTISGSAGTDQLGSLTTDGTAFLANYTISGAGASNGFWARRIAADGTVLGTTTTLPFPASTSSFDGTHYVLGATSGNAVRLSRVTTSGGVLPAYDLTLPYPVFSPSLTRATGSRRSFLVYNVYDEALQNRRIKGRFVAFTSPPTTTDASHVIVEDTPKAITLSATDSDGDPLTYTIVSGPTHGALSGTAPNLTYTPAANYFGPDSFTFKVNDGTQDSNTSTVSLTISAVNDAPVANDSSVTTNEDTAVAVPLSASDAEGTALTYTIIDLPAHGVLTGSGANQTYTPDANYHGTDSFRFFVNDGQKSSLPATVTVTLDPVDDVPAPMPLSKTVAEDGSVALTLIGNDFDDGDVLSFAVVAGPTHGTLSGSAPNLTYTPAPNYHGGDSFTWRVSDGTNDSAPGPVSITVTPVNDAPIANAQTTSVAEDGSVAITLTGSDVDGDGLAYAIVSGPTHGTLTGSGAVRTYTPAANYHGPDAFSFQVADGTVSSSPATVSITVTPVNDAPVANAQSKSVAEDGSVAITLTGTDAEGDALTYSIVAGPTHGTLTGSGAARTYTPDANYNGPDAFTFRVNDGTADSPTATVSITVTPVNDAPVAIAQSKNVAEDGSVAITLTGSDVDGDALSFIVVVGPAHGTLGGTAPDLTYTPAANYHGPDAFTFRVNDGTANSANATVSITVTPVNDAPTAVAQSKTVAEDGSASITLAGTDPDGDPLTYAVAGGPTHGTLGGTAPNLTYTPAANYNGPDAFTFTVNDGTTTSTAATVSITVIPVNDAPVAIAQSKTVAEDGSVAITLTGSDVDGDTLSFSVASGPAHGALTGTAPNLTYTPAANYNGPDAFTFTVNDGTATSTAATVSITVTPVNDAPVAIAQSKTVAEDGSVAVTLSGTDPDGDSPSYAVTGNPAHGTLSGTAPNLTYTPAANYNGPDAFTFTVNDGTTTSPAGTVSITVTPVNDAPVAVAQSVSTTEDSALAIVVAGTDIDGDPLSISVTGGPTHGALTGTPPNLTYTPAANYHGTDAFTFTVSDGVASSSPATVSITISSSNDTPVAVAQDVTTAEDSALAITLSATDADDDPLTYTVGLSPAHGTLTGTPPNLTYTPAANYHGADTFTFRAGDGIGLSQVVAIDITVTPVNDAPVAVAQAAMTAEDVPVVLALSGTDVDGDALTYAIATPPAHGTLSGTPPSVTYTPAANYHGPDSFTFTANDGALSSAPAAVSLTVAPINDAPVANAQALTTDEDTALAITLTGSDVEGDALTFVVVNAPAHGTLTGSGADLTYTPAADYHGADELTFEVRAGTVSSAAATVAITVTPANDAPVATAQVVHVDQGEQVAITLAGTDVDGDTLSYAIASEPSDGTLTGTPPELSYLAPASFRGPVTFTFTASDGTLTSAAGTVTVNVNNGAPTVTAAADSANPTEGQEVAFTATAADPGGDALTFAWEFGDGATSADQHPTHVYTDDGTYTATVTVSDGLATASASVELTVQNGAPSIVPATGEVMGDEASELAFTVAVTDPGTLDTHTITWNWDDNTPPTTGSSVTHTYADDGSYTVIVTVTDDSGAEVVGSRVVTIANVAPVPVPQDPLTTDAGVEVAAQLSATDRAGSADPLTWTLVEGPGTLTADGAYSWTPESADAGGHVITARVSDDEGGANDLTFSVEVIAPPSDGCGCRTTGSRGAPASGLVILGAIALSLRRRQRRGAVCSRDA